MWATQTPFFLHLPRAGRWIYDTLGRQPQPAADQPTTISAAVSVAPISLRLVGELPDFCDYFGKKSNGIREAITNNPIFKNALHKKN